MTTHYSLLGVEPSAPAEEVKRAFRREVARYHPDKVQHLGTEFQVIATDRAAALTEAYRILMDVDLRRQYDEQLARGPAAPAAPAVPPTSAADASPAPHEPILDRRVAAADSGSIPLVTRAVLLKLRAAADAAGAAVLAVPGFDLGYRLGGRRSLFRSAEPAVRVGVKVVPRVDADAVTAAWPLAARLQHAGEAVCLMLVGTGLAPSRELAAAVADQRRKSRNAAPVVVPVDLRDWQALIPPETPPSVRSLLDRVRLGE